MFSASANGRKSGLGRLAHFLHVNIPEVWLRFLLALVGLILAFGAALFSTVSRESGNLWATLILASAALLLATIVGLTTVPYLAQRVATARVRDALDYEVTRVGMVYVVIVLLIGIAALNTGNNLLYIIVAAMLAAILVSGVGSSFMLRHLEIDVRLPQHVFARRTVAGRFVLKNQRRRIPAFSVSIVSLKRSKVKKQWQLAPSNFTFPPGRAAARAWFQIPDRRLQRVVEAPPAPRIFEGSAYFPYLPAGHSLAAEVELHFDRRGRYHQDSFGLMTRFPFPFLRKTRRVPLSREVVVYPPVEQTDQYFEILPMITGEFETFARGRGHDLYRIREYLPQDSARYIDWKATARSGTAMVREFSREDERKLRIVFDNPEPGTAAAGDYERVIALAASLGWHFAEENSEISFLAQGYEGGPDIYRFLEYLATVEPGKGPSLLENLNVSDDYNIIFTARAHGTIPTSLWACSYFVFIGG